MINFRRAILADVQIISELIAPYVDDLICNETSRQRFQPEALAIILQKDGLHYYLAVIDSEVIGGIAYQAPSHLMHYFVKVGWQGKGYGRQMWQFIYGEMTTNANVHEITVNSSVYAVKIYETYGFEVVGELTEKNAVRFIPMKKKILQMEKERI